MGRFFHWWDTPVTPNLGDADVFDVDLKSHLFILQLLAVDEAAVSFAGKKMVQKLEQLQPLKQSKT